jgi:prefoldin beta subunit
MARYDQLQQNLRSVLIQKQQVDAEASEVDRAITELKKASETDAVYKSAGNILIKAKKEELLKELEERKELAGTRSTVLAKQEQRVRESINELTARIEGGGKGPTGAQTAPSNKSAPASS